MKTLLHFKDFVNEIMESNSRKYKQEILQKYKDDEVIKKYLQINFDPYKVYGISTKKLSKQVVVGDTWCAPTVFDLFDYLEKNNTGRDVDVAVCQLAVSWLTDGPECVVLLENLICKEVTLGIDAKTINKEIPGLIPQFSCMLAQKYFDNPAKLEGKTFAITTKLDGFRLVALKDTHGNVKFYSRVGQLIEGLVEIEEELKKHFPNDIALDGELTISNYFDMPSKDAYKAASKIIRLKGDTPKTGLTYRVFDCMTAKEFTTQQCSAVYGVRRGMLDNYAGRAPHIEVLPVLYMGTDTSKVTEWLNKITSEGGEGCMLNVCDAEYSWSRSWAIMKVKKFQSLDLEVEGIEEGSGRLAGTLGAIYVRYKDGNTVKVGSGFSDEERALYWSNPDLIIHKIVEVKYFEESTNADGTFSLRFPTWVSNIRDPRDKVTPDF